ncbi:hypothetical protein [Coprobacter sp.]
MPEQRDADVVETMMLLSISDAEKQEFGYKVENNRIRWDDAVNMKREFILSLDQQLVSYSIINKMKKLD